MIPNCVISIMTTSKCLRKGCQAYIVFCSRVRERESSDKQYFYSLGISRCISKRATRITSRKKSGGFH